MSMVGLDKEIVSAFSRVRCNTSTCSGNVTGTTPIVAGSGTGAYGGISGTFIMTVTIDEIVVKSKCSPSGEFLAQAIVMTGSGDRLSLLGQRRRSRAQRPATRSQPVIPLHPGCGA
jgi:hypothetical protein